MDRAHKVALAIGWTFVGKEDEYDEPFWRDENGHYLFGANHMDIDKNLSMAVRYIVPWLNDVKNVHEYWYHFRDAVLYYDHPQTKDSDWQMIDKSMDSSPDVRLADMLCTLALEVANG